MRRPAIGSCLASCLVALLFASGLAGAHGSTKPLHGGVVQMVGEMSFELVVRPEGVEVYLIDDGEDVDTSGLSAKLTITRDGTTTEAGLVPGGGNRCVGQGVQVPAGSRVGVILTLEDNESRISARFAVPWRRRRSFARWSPGDPGRASRAPDA